MDSIRIIIADDHPLERAGLREAIDRESDMRVMAGAGDTAAAHMVTAAHIAASQSVARLFFVACALLMACLATLPSPASAQQKSTRRSIPVTGMRTADSARFASLRRQAMAAIRQDQLPEGRELLQEAERLAAARGDEASRQDILQHIASTYEAEGALSRALELLLACLAYHQRLGHVRECAMLHLNIGNIHYRIGSVEQALRDHLRAAELGRTSGTPYLRGRIHFAIGCDYEKTGKADSAEASFTAAERIAREAGDTDGIGQARTRLGGVRIRQGRLREAQHDFDVVLSMEGLDDSHFIIAEAWRGKGMVYTAGGEYRLAVDAYERAAQISTQHGQRELLLDVLAELAWVHEAMGEYHAAYHVARRYTIARDSLLSAQNRTQVNELLARYEAGQREQQILLLEKENRLKASDLQRQQLLARERASAIELLAGQNAIQQLQLDLTSAKLREEGVASREKEQRLLLEQKENTLQKAMLEQQRFERNAIAAGFIALTLGTVLLVRYLRLRRRASEERAAAAELRAEAAANESLLLRTEIAEREHEAQRQFSRALLRAQEEERQRIASDLHDSLAQKLVVIQNRASLARKHVEGNDAALQQFTRIADTAVETISEIRAISHALRPLLLRRFGLSASLRGLVDELDGISELHWTADIDDLSGLLESDDEINLYRIVQEAANNTLRHARARSARITVRRVDAGIHVEIFDDGQGWPVHATGKQGSANGNGMGIDGMRHRAELLGATLHIDSAPGRGTRIVLDIPSRTSPS